jgi:hypothetical protein
MKLMDCQTALDLLEVDRSGDDDTERPEIAAATKHLDSCAECVSVVQSRQSFDDSVVRLIRDIPIPDGFEQCLLENLAAHDSSAVTPAVSPAKPKHSRRRWLIGTASAAVCLIAGVWIWYGMQPADPTLTLADVRRGFAAEFDQIESLPKFDRNFKSLLPGYEWKVGRIVVDTERVNGYGEQTNGQHLAAVYTFRLAYGRRSVVRGALIVLRSTSVKAVPPDQHFSADRIAYVGRFATVSWSNPQHGLIYVCVVPVNGDGLNRLQQALQIEPV